MGNNVEKITQRLARLAYGLFKSRAERSEYVRELEDSGDLDGADSYVMSEIGSIASVVQSLRSENKDDIYAALENVGEGALWGIIVPLENSLDSRADKSFLMACLKTIYPDKTWEEIEVFYEEEEDIDSPSFVIGEAKKDNLEECTTIKDFSIEKLPEINSFLTAQALYSTALKISHQPDSHLFFAPLFEKVFDTIEALEAQQSVLTLEEEIYLASLHATALMSLPFNNQHVIAAVAYEATALEHVASSIKYLKDNRENHRYHDDPDKRFYLETLPPILDKIRDRMAKHSGAHPMFTRPLNTVVDLFAVQEAFQLEEIINWDAPGLKQNQRQFSSSRTRLPKPHIE